MLEQIFLIISWPWLPAAVALGLVVYAATEWLILSGRLSRLRRDAQEAQAQLQGLGDLASREALTQALNQPSLRPAVAALSASLLEPLKKGGRLRAPVPPETFFTGLIDGRLNLRHVQAVPNYLVGLGLLFTFIGLISALYFAGDGVSSNNLTVAQDALHKLLQAATFKFTSSVVGLFLSILFAAGYRHKIYQMQQLYRELIQAITIRLDGAAPTHMMEDLLTANRAQTEALQEVAHALAGNPEKTRKKLQTIADEFNTALMTGMKDYVSALNISLKSTSTILDDFNNTLQAHKDSLLEKVSQAGTQLEDHSQQTLEAFTRASKQFETVGETLSQCTQQIEKQNQASTASLTQMEEISRTIAAIVPQIEKSTQQIKTLNEELGQGGHRFSDMSDRMAVAAGQLDDTNRLMNETGTHIKALWESYHERFAGMDHSISRLADELGKGLASYHQSINDFVMRLDDKLGQTLSDMATRIENEPAPSQSPSPQGPAPQEPVAQEPVAQEQATQEPTTQEPTTQEPDSKDRKPSSS
ncbi:MAG: hypothetical protein AAF442_03205 [Pseudomonadota bacterium]